MWADGGLIDYTVTKGNLLRYEGWFQDEGYPDTTLLLTELCAGGDLNNYIKELPRGMKATPVLRVISQLASALEYLHERGVFHSDVKPRNVLIRSLSPIDVVLGDCADIMPLRGGSELRGTATFYSPEMLKRNAHTGPPDDIWALGVSTLSMTAHSPRFLYEEEAGKMVKKIEKYPRQC